MRRAQTGGHKPHRRPGRGHRTLPKRVSAQPGKESPTSAGQSCEPPPGWRSFRAAAERRSVEAVTGEAVAGEPCAAGGPCLRTVTAAQGAPRSPVPRSPPVSGQRRRPAPHSPPRRPPRAAPEQGRRGCSSPLVLRPLRPRPGRPAPAASAERARPRYRRLGSVWPCPPPRYIRRPRGQLGGADRAPPAVRGPGERRQPASGTLRGRDPAPTRRSLTSRVVQKPKEIGPLRSPSPHLLS